MTVNTRAVLLLASIAALAACNRLSHQTSVHDQIRDETKAISDIASGLAGELNLRANRADFDYGGASGRQTAYELSGPSSVIFVQTESATYCGRKYDPDHPTFDDRLLVVNLSASTSEGLAASMAALRQASEANGGSVVTNTEQVCRRG